MRDTRSSAEKMFSIHVYDLKRDMKETNNQYVIQVTPKDAALRRPDIITRLRHVYSLTQEARSGEVEAFVVNARLLSSDLWRGERLVYSTASQVNSISTARKLVRNADSWAPRQPYRIRSAGGGNQQFVF